MPSISKPQTDWVLVAILFAAGLFAAAQFGKISLTLAEFAGVYDRTITGVSFLVSMVGLIGILCGLFAGQVVASLGGKRVLIAALCLGAALSLIQATLPALPFLTVLRGLEGFSHVAIVVAGPPLMAAAATDKDRPLVMAIWGTFFGLSFALSAWLFPPILGAGGLPLLFILHALSLLIIAALVWWRAKATDRAPFQANIIAMHKQAYARLRIVTPALGFMFYTASFVALLTFLPAAMNRPEWAIGMALLNIAGTLIGGKLVQMDQPHRVAALGFAGTLVFCALTQFGFEWACFPLFIFLGIVPGASFAYIPDLNPSDGDRALATGVLAQTGNIGTASGTPVFAFILAMGGLGGILTSTILLSALGFIVTLILHQKIAKD